MPAPTPRPTFSPLWSRKFFQSKSSFLAMSSSPAYRPRPLIGVLFRVDSATTKQLAVQREESRLVAPVLIRLLGFAPRGLVVRLFLVGFLFVRLLFLGLLFCLRLGRGSLGCAIHRRGRSRRDRSVCGRIGRTGCRSSLTAGRRIRLRAGRRLGIGVLPTVVNRDDAVQR